MICCGEDRTGKFCPECGESLYSSPAAELRRFVSASIGNNRGQIKQREACGNPDSDRAKRIIKRHLLTIEKKESLAEVD